MRNKYKMRDKNSQSNKQFNLTEQNINFKSPINVQRSKSPQNNIIKRLRNFNNQNNKNIINDEIEKKDYQKKTEKKTFYSKNAQKNNNDDKTTSFFKTKSFTTQSLKPNKIITKTLSILDNNSDNSKIIKKQKEIDYAQIKTQNNKNKINQNLVKSKNTFTEANENELENNISKNEINRKLSINSNTNYIKKKPVYISKRSLYKNINKPNSTRNYNFAYNVNNNANNANKIKENSDSIINNNNKNDVLNTENSAKDINIKFKVENEIKTKYIQIKPPMKKNFDIRNSILENKNKVDDINDNLINKKDDNENDNENSINKFNKINLRYSRNQIDDKNELKKMTLIQKKDDNNNLNSGIFKNNSTRMSVGLYSKKKLKTDLNNDFNQNQLNPMNSTSELRKPFQYLVQQISKNKNFNTPFIQFSEFQKNKQKYNNNINQNDTSFMNNERNYSSNMNFDKFNLHLDLSRSSLNRIMGRNISHKKMGHRNIFIDHNKTPSDKKLSFNNNINRINTMDQTRKSVGNHSFINHMNNDDNNISLISNNIINNNTFNATFNFYNFNDNNNNNDNSPIKSFGISSSIDLSTLKNSNSFIFDIKVLYLLESKLKNILDKIINYQDCENECYNYIKYYFTNRLYDEFLKFFKNNHNKSNALNQIKIELICLFLCYDISVGRSFNQTAILLKTILEIIYSNNLVMISFILSQNQNIYINEKSSKLKQIIKNNLKIKLIKEDMNEYNILKIITNNSKNLLNYYKIIIDNIYNRYYIENEESLKFPQCLRNINNFNKSNQYKLMNIISIFFFDSYRLINNYNFNDLFNFFNIFISKESNNQYNNNINYSIGGKTSSTNDLKVTNKPNFFLPPINKKYKYTLILDLDETLIYLKNKINISNNDKFLGNQFSSSILILRPGLIDFLKKMKQIYELIIFSSGTLDYIMPIIKIIEKKGKFFEYILYRKHISFLKNGEYYKDLSLLNRNLKNVIIVDDMAKNFVLHKSNGICIKPFKGDVINNRNTLELLGKILQKIRYDADITGDIRISLQEEKNIIYSEIAVNVKKDYIDNHMVED